MNFDFHNLLFPAEFERLCRDIMEIREKPITFTSYRRGRDGGIDFKATKGAEKIIGQCKLYNPNNYSSFIASLKKELKKCKRIQPDRYIICTSLHLGAEQVPEILTLFQNYVLNEEDIIDAEKLNKYLSQPEYEHLLKTYSKLLVPNLHFVELALDKIVNKKYYAQTESFLKDIRTKHKLYHNTKILENCIDILEKNKVIILTGNPGVGKTTTAKMIANYFMHQKIDNILFLSNFNFLEVEGLLKKNQLIIIDDFWGQNFSPDLRNNGSMLRNFTRIINDFKNNTHNRYLVLTSREYIIKDILNNAEYETQKLLKTESYLINLNDYDNEDKVRIFLNHLIYFDFEKEYFTCLKYDDFLEKIIVHENYSPRHIEYYINQYISKGPSNRYHFYQSFYKYLNNPQAYWNEIFKNKTSDTSQLILLLLLISSDPIDIKDLERMFEATQGDVRKVLNKNIQPLDFHSEINILQDFYLVTEEQDYSDQIVIWFQSPGIKDFLLEYLRTDGRLWIKPLIKNALFFNQLNFIFDTKESEVEDYDTDISLFGQKIVLSEALHSCLKKKLLDEFHQLNFCTTEEREFTGEFSKGHSPEEAKYWKLILLNRFFPISDEKNRDVKDFIVDEVSKDIEDYKGDGKIVNWLSMPEFPRVIKLVQPFMVFNPTKLIEDYYESITFTNEFNSFYEFKDIFPKEFDRFIAENIGKIRKDIRYQIIDDIEYYDECGMDFEFDIHLDFHIGDVCKKYGVRLTSKFIKEIGETAGRSFHNFTKRRTKTKKAKKSADLRKKKSKPRKFSEIVTEYLPEELHREFNAIQYLKEIERDKKFIRSVICELKKDESILKVFTDNEQIFSSVLEFILQKNLEVNSYNYYTIMDTFFIHYCESNGLDPKILKHVFLELSENSFNYDYSITKTQLDGLLKKYNLPRESSIFYPVLVPDKHWFKFSSYDMKVYFILEYLNAIIDDDQFKEEVIDYSDVINGSNILEILTFVCEKRVRDVIVIPELNRFLSEIDTTSDKAVVLCLLKFFNAEVELEWDKRNKSFINYCSSNSESFFEIIFSYLEIDFELSFLDIFFCKEYFSKENISSFFIITKNYSDLYKRIIHTVDRKNRVSIVTEEKITCFDINLFDFASNEENYVLLKEIGLEKYVLSQFEAIRRAIAKYIIVF